MFSRVCVCIYICIRIEPLIFISPNVSFYSMGAVANSHATKTTDLFLPMGSDLQVGSKPHNGTPRNQRVGPEGEGIFITIIRVKYDVGWYIMCYMVEYSILCKFAKDFQTRFVFTGGLYTLKNKGPLPPTQRK